MRMRGIGLTAAVRNGVAALVLPAWLAGCGGDPAPPDAGAIATMARDSSLVATQASVVEVAGYRENFTLMRTGDGGAVTLASRLSGEVRRFDNPGLIKFFDKWTSFDSDGVEGEIYRLYQAAFGRVPDQAGLGFWIHAAQASPETGVQNVARQFLASDEFKELYGATPSAEAYVSALYHNILRRGGDPAGHRWWVDNIGRGQDRAQVLFGFSESGENRKAVDPRMANGIDFVPFKKPGAIVPERTSYANAKENGRGPISLPHDARYADAYVEADFMQDGSMSLFTAKLTYTPAKPLNEATPGRFAFWTKTADGGWSERNDLIVGAQDGCLHPRKAIAADFNDDGKPDVLVACHGYDAPPFPGEAMVLLLSGPGGKYQLRHMSEFKGFFHAVAAADIDKDGLIDVVATDSQGMYPLRVLINRGDGSFTERSELLPTTLAQRRSQPYFTVEVADINGDGNVDLLVGGHEWEGDAMALLFHGDRGPGFAASAARIIPAVPGHGVVLDFLMTSKGLVVNRTSGGIDAPFYQSAVLQLVDPDTLSSSIVLERDGGEWIRWLVPTSDGVASADTTRPGGAVL